MEEREQRSKASGALKTAKKGVKQSKALSAEEEARRREALREKLREKLELEKRAQQVVERLLEDSVAEDFLIDCARFITPANYKDTVEERSIAKLCGYPLCPNKLGKIPAQRYKISTKTNRVYDITERKLFCSNFCYKASKQFELQISKTPLWLRQHESPPEITLMKKGDSGSSGEEVKLSEKRLQEEDIENPLSAQTEDTQDSQLPNKDCHHSDESENEQDFVSSVVSQQTGPRVHWGDLPKRHDPDMKPREKNEESMQNKAQNVDKKRKEDEKQMTNGKQEQKELDETTTQLNLCTLSETVTEEKSNLTCDISSNPSIKSEQYVISPQNSTNTDTTGKTSDGFCITQVGMSKKGAAGLRNLLKHHQTKPESIRHSLLECLKKTLREWSTDETLSFLYGSEHSLGKPFEEKVEEEKEELDEDDIEDVQEEGGRDGEGRPTGAVPSFKTLRKEAQNMELRVREFYKGTWVLPEDDVEKFKDQSVKEPVLPPVDSRAQHMIQKRITVEKLTGCLKNIVGPLHLTMSDVSTDLNNLVRTFRFTNTNIIHKPPEWTLIAVVLLHLLSEVSPLIREALEQPTSVHYLNTLMVELGLKEEDLLSLLHLFRTSTN